MSEEYGAKDNPVFYEESLLEKIEELEKSLLNSKIVIRQFNIAYQALQDCLSKTSEVAVEEICCEALDEIKEELAR